MDHLDDLIKQISEDLKKQLETQNKIDDRLRKKLEDLGISVEQPVHIIVNQLLETKVNLEELHKYYFSVD